MSNWICWQSVLNVFWTTNKDTPPWRHSYLHVFPFPHSNSAMAIDPKATVFIYDMDLVTCFIMRGRQATIRSSCGRLSLFLDPTNMGCRRRNGSFAVCPTTCISLQHFLTYVNQTHHFHERKENRIQKCVIKSYNTAQQSNNRANISRGEKMP